MLDESLRRWRYTQRRCVAGTVEDRGGHGKASSVQELSHNLEYKPSYGRAWLLLQPPSRDSLGFANIFYGKAVLSQQGIDFLDHFLAPSSILERCA